MKGLAGAWPCGAKIGCVAGVYCGADDGGAAAESGATGVSGGVVAENVGVETGGVLACGLAAGGFTPVCELSSVAGGSVTLTPAFVPQ